MAGSILSAIIHCDWNGIEQTLTEIGYNLDLESDTTITSGYLNYPNQSNKVYQFNKQSQNEWKHVH